MSRVWAGGIMFPPSGSHLVMWCTYKVLADKTFYTRIYITLSTIQWREQTLLSILFMSTLYSGIILAVEQSPKMSTAGLIFVWRTSLPYNDFCLQHLLPKATTSLSTSACLLKNYYTVCRSLSTRTWGFCLHPTSTCVCCIFYLRLQRLSTAAYPSMYIL